MFIGCSPFQYIILGTSDGAVRMLDHAGNFLKDRLYHLVSIQEYVDHVIVLSYYGVLWLEVYA